MAADPAHRMVRGAFAPADEGMVEEEEDYENSSPTTVSAGWMWTGRDTERSASGRELTRRRSGDGLPLVPRPQPRQEPPLPSYAEFLGGSGDGSDGGGDGSNGNPNLKIESAVLFPFTDSGAASPAATAATAAATKAAIASAAAASAASAAAAAAAAAVVGIAAGDELRVAPMMMETAVDSHVSSKESAGAAGSPDGVAVWASGAASSDAAGPDRPPRGDPSPQGDSAAAASTGGDVKNSLLPDQINARTVTVAQTTSPPPTKIEPTEAERRGERGGEERGAAWEAETTAASAATVVAPGADLPTLTGEGVPSRREESSAPAEATAAAVEGQLGLYCGDLIASAETTRPGASVKTQRSIQQVIVQQEPSADGTSQAESNRAGAEVVGDGSGGGDGRGGEGGGGSGGVEVAGDGMREGSTTGGVRGGVQAQALEMRETGTGRQTKQWGGTKRTAGTSASMVFGDGVRVEARSPSQGDRGWTEGAMGADVEPRTVEAETQGVEESVDTAAEVPSPRRLVESPPLVSPSASVSEEVVPLVEVAGDIVSRGAGTSVLPSRFAVERTEPAAAVAASGVEMESSEVDVFSARENRVSSSRTHSDANEEGVESSAATGVSPPSRWGTSDTAATQKGNRGGHYEVESAKADVASMRDNRVPSCQTPAEVDEEGVESSATAAGVSSPSRLGASDIAVTDTSAHQAKRESEGIAAVARPPAAAAAAEGAVPLVGNNARGKKIESLARAWKMRDNRGGEADLAVDLADAAAEEAAVIPAPGRAAEGAAAQEATLTADVHVAEPGEIGVDATSRHVANRGAGEVEMGAGAGGAAVAAGVAVALSAIKDVVAPALPPPEAVGRTIDEVARRGDADELRVEEGKEAREKRETVVDARNGPAAAVTVGAAPGRGERKAELSRRLLETAPVGTVLEAETGAVDSRVVSQTGVPGKFEAGGSVDVAAEDVGADEAAAATGNATAAGTAAALGANLVPCAKSRKRETFAAEAAAEAAVAPATSAAAAVAMSSNGNRTRGGSIVLRSRSCSASAWPGPEDLDETFPPITVEEAAAFMGSAADGFGVGTAGFGQRFASKSSWTSTATSAIADIDRSVSSLPPSTPTLAAGSPPTRSAGFGGKGTSGRGAGVHHAGAAPAGSSASATAAAAATAAAGGGGIGEDGAPVWGEAAFGSFPGLDHFLSSSVDGFSGVRARRVGSDVPYSRTRAAGDGYRRAAATRRSNSLDAGDFSTTGGMDDRRRSSVDGAVGVRRGAPAPGPELASESGRLGGSGAAGVSRGEGSPAADEGGGGAVTITEEKVVEEEEFEAEEEVGGGGQNGGKSGVPLQQTPIAPGGGGGGGGSGGGSGGDCGGGGCGSGGGDGDGSFGNGGTNPLSSTALTMGAAATVEKPVGGDVASGAWVERKGGAVVVAQAEDALGSGSVSKPSAAPVVITTSAATSLLDNGGEGRLESPLVGGDRGRPGAGSGARRSSGGGGGGCCVMS